MCKKFYVQPFPGLYVDVNYSVFKCVYNYKHGHINTVYGA